MNFKSSLLCISLLIVAKYANASRSIKPARLLSPINIDTSKVNPSFDFIKISVDIYRTATASGIAINTGREITFPLNKKQEMNTPRITYGNVTCVLSDRYLLINQNGSHKNRSGHTLNDKGYPIEAINIFANIDKYGSLHEANKHPDGLFVLSQPVDVIDTPNPTFIPFGTFLRSGKLKTPNSSAKFSTLFSFIWYDSLVRNRAYYIYKGSLYDPKTNTQIREVTQIVPQPPYSFLSYEQFAAFKNVLDEDGNPLSTLAPLNPVKGREIKAVKGLFLEIRPFYVTLFVP